MGADSSGDRVMLNLQRPEERKALADFVRECRARTRPQDVGLPTGTRRRTPGLRREEVAQLAGVSVTWYTWFEQGRDIQVSSQFLDKVSVALGLDDSERAHLFDLAQRRSIVPAAPVRPEPATAQGLVPSRRLPPVAVNINRPAVTPLRLSATDAETHRINEAIRKVIGAEEARPLRPPTAPAPPARKWRLVTIVSGAVALIVVFFFLPH